MNLSTLLYPLLGGALIGAAATLMLIFNGRVTGVSGILSSILSAPKKEELWRWYFTTGLIFGGILVKLNRPELFLNISGRSTILIVIAGLFVGYGTVMGNGCTSGHGVCGISRLSVRSLFATITFMLFGFLAVQIVASLSGGPL